MTLPGASGLFGGRVASGWGLPSARAVARSHVTGVVVGLAAITGVAVWSSAASHLVSTPARYGVTWDAVVSPDQNRPFSPDPTVLDGAAERLSDDKSAGTLIARVMGGMYGPGGDTEIIEIDRTSGSWWPTVIAGRVPMTDDEITVGVLFPGLGLGDTIDVAGRTVTVVGKHVVPAFSNGIAGVSVAISYATAPDLSLDQPNDAVEPTLIAVHNIALVVDLAAGATIDDLSRVLGNGLVATESHGAPPGDIANLGRTGGLTDLLLATCVALGFAAFANGLIVATRARRADHATLRALGAQQRTIAGSVAWHGGLVVLAGAALGVPIGLVLGRTVWRRTTSGISAVPDLWRCGVVAAAVSVVTILAAGAVVIAIASVSARRRFARLPE